MKASPLLCLLALLVVASPAAAAKKKKKEDALPPVRLRKMTVPPKGGFDFIPGTRVTKPKFSIYGKRFDATEVCTEGGINTPSSVRIYKTGNKIYPYAAWCPGLLEGDMNVITIFGPDVPHFVRKAKPEDETKIRIKWEQFQEGVQKLILKSEKTP